MLEVFFFELNTFKIMFKEEQSTKNIIIGDNIIAVKIEQIT